MLISCEYVNTQENAANTPEEICEISVFSDLYTTTPPNFYVMALRQRIEWDPEEVVVGYDLSSIYEEVDDNSTAPVISSVVNTTDQAGSGWSRVQHHGGDQQSGGGGGTGGGGSCHQCHHDNPHHSSQLHCGAPHQLHSLYHLPLGEEGGGAPGQGAQYSGGNGVYILFLWNT